MKWVRIFGKFLISVGVGVLLFVAWALWGTGIYARQQQERLEEELANQPPIHVKRDPKTGFVGPGPDFAPAPGTPVFKLNIPAIELSDVVVEGVDVEELKLGPGHYPDCRDGFSLPLCTEEDEVWPGEQGRVIVSAHRTTYDAPFWDLDKLEEGDEIITEPKWGEFTYRVTKKMVVDPSSRAIADPDSGRRAEIVLTTCNPKFSAEQRLVILAEMEKGSV